MLGKILNPLKWQYLSKLKNFLISRLVLGRCIATMPEICSALETPWVTMIWQAALFSSSSCSRSLGGWTWEHLASEGLITDLLFLVVRTSVIIFRESGGETMGLSPQKH